MAISPLFGLADPERPRHPFDSIPGMPGITNPGDYARAAANDPKIRIRRDSAGEFGMPVDLAGDFPT